MKSMATRREFTKSLGGAVAIAALNPIFGCAADDPKVAPEAAKLYRESFILDCNAFASIGQLPSQSQQTEIAAGDCHPGGAAGQKTPGGAPRGISGGAASTCFCPHFSLEKTECLFSM